MLTQPTLRRRLEIQPNPFPIEDWLEVPIGDGWVAAYRLVYRGRPNRRRTRIVELRIFLDGPDRKPGERGQNPRLPQFSFARLRRHVTEREFAACLAAVTTNLAAQNKLALLGRPGARLDASRREGRGAGRPPVYPLAFYAKVALQYDTIEHNARREPGASTREQLRARHHVPISTIGKWLRTARQHGFLTPTLRGGRGSRATDAARLAARGQQ